MEARLFIARFATGDYTPEEYEAFLRWAEEAPLNENEAAIKIHEKLMDEWPLGAGPSAGWIEQMEGKLDLADERQKLMPPRIPDQPRPIIWLESDVSRSTEPPRSKGTKVPVKKLVWMAAASVLLALTAGIGAYWFVGRSGRGSSVNNAETFSIMTVPRGQQGQLVLADGSKVWLNSASVLRYPVAFTGQERVVELSGEALFEIAPNAGTPFLVRSGDLQVEVMGTTFDIRNYEDEPIGKTSLLEGSVRIIKGADAVILQPGDLAETGFPSEANNPATIRVTHGIDPQLVLAWKDGYMRFENDDLKTVMREIARRYDLVVRYQGKIPERHFTGKFNSSEDIHQILKILELQQ